MIKQLTCDVEAHRVFHYQEIDHVSWALLITCKDNGEVITPGEFTVYLAGKCLGQLTPIVGERRSPEVTLGYYKRQCYDQHILLKNLMVDPSINVSNKLESPEKLKLNAESSVDTDAKVVDVLEYSVDPEKAPPFVQLFGPNISRRRVLLGKSECCKVDIVPPDIQRWAPKSRLFIYLIIYAIIIKVILIFYPPIPCEPKPWLGIHCPRRQIRYGFRFSPVLREFFLFLGRILSDLGMFLLDTLMTLIMWSPWIIIVSVMLLLMTHPC